MHPAQQAETQPSPSSTRAQPRRPPAACPARAFPGAAAGPRRLHRRLFRGRRAAAPVSGGSGTAGSTCPPAGGVVAAGPEGSRGSGARPGPGCAAGAGSAMRGPWGAAAACAAPGEAPGRGRAGSAPAASAERRPGLPAPNGRVLGECEPGASLPKEGWSRRRGPERSVRSRRQHV